MSTSRNQITTKRPIRWPVVVVDSFDHHIAFDTEESARFYHYNWPNKNGLLMGERHYDQYGDTQEILRDGKQIGIRWIAA